MIRTNFAMSPSFPSAIGVAVLLAVGVPAWAADPILRHKAVSADGKTKRETVHGTDEHGKPFEQIEVYERIQQ